MQYFLNQNELDIDQNGLCTCPFSQFQIHTKADCQGVKNWILTYHELVKLYAWLVHKLEKLVKSVIGNYHTSEKILYV